MDYEETSEIEYGILYSPPYKRKLSKSRFFGAGYDGTLKLFLSIISLIYKIY